MNNGRHRRTKPRHRRTTLGDHARRLGAVLSLSAATIGLLYAVPNQADAKSAYAQTMSEPEAQTDYGSGFPGGPVGTPVKSTADYTGRSVWMVVGDSITVRGYKALAATHPDQRLAVDAWSGRNTQLAVDSVLATLNEIGPDNFPAQLIMATGTNDIFNPFVMPAQIQRLLSAVPSTTKVYWVDVQADRPSYTGDQRNSMMVNKAIWQNCTGNCEVISWAGFLAAKPSRLGMYIDAGGVHPTIPTGVNAWAAVLGGAVDL